MPAQGPSPHGRVCARCAGEYFSTDFQHPAKLIGPSKEHIIYTKSLTPANINEKVEQTVTTSLSAKAREMWKNANKKIAARRMQNRSVFRRKVPPAWSEIVLELMSAEAQENEER